MGIPINKKAQAQKIIDRIINGNFDEGDLINLLISLRPYTYGNLYFRELCDFVAHNDERNQGITFDTIKGLYLRFSFLNDYHLRNKSLNIVQPFPSYIKTLILYEINKCDEQFLRTNFNLNKNGLISAINGDFKEDKKTKIIKPSGKLKLNQIEAIDSLIGKLDGTPVFTQNKIIDSIIDVLIKNKIKFNEKDLRAKSDYITVCLLSLFHKTKFTLDENKLGECIIISEKSSVVINAKIEPGKLTYNVVDGDFGKLQINAIVGFLSPEGNKFYVSISILLTELLAEEWCHESMFRIEEVDEKLHFGVSNDLFKAKPVDKNFPYVFIKTINSESYFTINDEFKIIAELDQDN